MDSLPFWLPESSKPWVTSLRHFASSAPGRYGVALLSTMLALFLQKAFGRFIYPTPFLVFFGAVMLSGWWGGGGPGLVSTVLSVMMVDFFFFQPFHSLKLHLGNAISIGLFLTIGSTVTWLNVTLRRTSTERSRLLQLEQLARAEAEGERARLRNLLMQAPAFVALFHGPEHIYILSNPLNDAALGHRPLLGKPLREAVPEAERQGFIPIFDRVYATGVEFKAQEYPWEWERPDGTKQKSFFNLVYQPMRDAQGRIDGVAAFRFDVTGLVLARQQAEALASELQKGKEELKRAESNARFLAEASAVMASSLDYESTLRNVARLAVPTLADWCLVDLVQPDGTLKRVETVNSPPEPPELAHDSQRIANTGEANIKSPSVQSFLRGQSLLIEHVTPEIIEKSVRDDDHLRLVNQMGPASFIAAPLVVRGRVLGVLSLFSTHSGRHYTQTHLALLEELARRAALSVENARLYREAQEAIRLRDEFLSIASHELKTPLTPLNLKLQMLSREAQRQPDSPFRKAVEGYIAVGARQVKRLSELVSDLLDVARIAGGRFRLELEEVELSTLAQEVVTRHELEAARVGSTFVVEAQASATGSWDRLRLEQVVTNLVDNAIKYGAGKPIHVSLEADPGRALLRVRDEGIGIAPEHLSRIFDRFERAVSDRHYGGLGLGLYISRTIVEAMGGAIEVQSTLGQGATFTVVLPRNQAEEGSARATQDSSEEPPEGAPAFRET